jgi:hypothetical protein
MIRATDNKDEDEDVDEVEVATVVVVKGGSPTEQPARRVSTRVKYIAATPSTSSSSAAAPAPKITATVLTAHLHHTEHYTNTTLTPYRTNTSLTPY